MSFFHWIGVTSVWFRNYGFGLEKGHLGYCSHCLKPKIHNLKARSPTFKRMFETGWGMHQYKFGFIIHKQLVIHLHSLLKHVLIELILSYENKLQFWRPNVEYRNKTWQIIENDLPWQNLGWQLILLSQLQFIKNILKQLQQIMYNKNIKTFVILEIIALNPF